MCQLEDQITATEQPLKAELEIIDAAIGKLKEGDLGAHFKLEVIEAASAIMDSDRELFQQKRGELKRANKESQITDWTKAVRRGLNGDDAQGTRADELVAHVKSKANLFIDEDENTYAVIEQDGHVETWPLKSAGIEKWLSYQAFNELGFSVSESTTKQTINTLCGIARFSEKDGVKVKPVWLRTAKYKDGYMLDMACPNWRGISVQPDGWRVVDDPASIGIHFVRNSKTGELPQPAPNGDTKLLWNYLNIPDEDHQLLVLAWLLQSWRTDTPFKLLLLVGEQGNAKSSTHRFIRALSDPNSTPLRAMPKSVEDIFVSAGINWQASFENMSSLSTAMQDALCTLATGCGYARRTLYTNNEETVIDVKRPVILNGIAPVATRPDLIDRLITITLPKIDDAKKKDEIKIAAEFERDKPIIFNGLLSLFSRTLAQLPEVTLDKKPRMVDFTRLGEAMAQALGKQSGHFTSIYMKNRGENLSHSLDASPAALAIQEMMTTGYTEKWEGTLKGLKEVLDENHKQEGEGWPKSPRGLGEILRRMAPALREMGIGIEFPPRSSKGSKVCIYLIPDFLGNKNQHTQHTRDTQKQAEIDQNLANIGKIVNV